MQVLSLHQLQTKGHEVAQLVEELRYKPEGRDSRLWNWNFSLT
jgi:hypothetical protein